MKHLKTFENFNFMLESQEKLLNLWWKKNFKNKTYFKKYNFKIHNFCGFLFLIYK